MKTKKKILIIAAIVAATVVTPFIGIALALQAAYYSETMSYTHCSGDEFGDNCSGGVRVNVYKNIPSEGMCKLYGGSPLHAGHQALSTGCAVK